MGEYTATPASGEPEASLAEISAQRIGPLRGFMRRHPVLVNAVVVLLYFLLAATALVDAARSAHWATVVLLALTGAALFLRRRWPMFVLVAVVLLDSAATLQDSTYFGGSAGLWIVLYTASTKYAARRMFVLTALITALQGLIFVMVGLPALFTDSPEDQAALAEFGGLSVTISLSLAFLLGTNAAAVAMGAAVRNHRLHEAELDNWAERVQTAGPGARTRPYCPGDARRRCALALGHDRPLGRRRGGAQARPGARRRGPWRAFRHRPPRPGGHAPGHRGAAHRGRGAAGTAARRWFHRPNAGRVQGRGTAAALHHHR